jgi:hypothetical protein
MTNQQKQNYSNILSAHNIAHWFDGDQLWVEEVSTMNGVVCVESIMLPCNVAVIKEWLGY